MLATLTDFSEAAAGGSLMTDVEKMEGLSGTLGAMLSRNQSQGFWTAFPPALSRMLQHHGAALLGAHNLRFHKDLTFHLMRRLVYKAPFVRRRGVFCLLMVLRVGKGGGGGGGWGGVGGH